MRKKNSAHRPTPALERMKYPLVAGHASQLTAHETLPVIARLKICKHFFSKHSSSKHCADPVKSLLGPKFLESWALRGVTAVSDDLGHLGVNHENPLVPKEIISSSYKHVSFPNGRIFR